VPALGRFAGILTGYGDASSHLGLSAVGMSISYRLVGPDRIRETIAASEVCVS